MVSFPSNSDTYLCVSFSLPQVVLGDQLVGGRFIAAQVQKLIAVAHQTFPGVLEQSL